MNTKQLLRQQKLNYKIKSMKSRVRKRQIKNALLIFSAATLIAFSLSGCCTKNPDGTETCFSNCSADVSGYALFGSGTMPTAGSTVNLQWSDDEFVTHAYTGTNIHNLQGMLAVPFDFKAYYDCSKTPQIQIRAYESSLGATSWQLGDVVGRYDGTPIGNSSYLGVSASSASDLLIYMDGVGAQ